MGLSRQIVGGSEGWLQVPYTFPFLGPRMGLDQKKKEG